jgi:hypothetical protein
MRKITIEFIPNEKAREGLEQMFMDVQSYEILEMLKVDYEEGICIDLIDAHLRDGVSIDDLKTIGNMEILNVLKSEGNKVICLVKYYEPEDSKDLFKEFDLGLIPTMPSFVSVDKCICTYIGENENLTKFIELIKTHAGEITNMSFKKAVYERQDLLSVLTDKQKDVLITAHKHGYYKYPKKINSEQLSKKVDIGKATLVQHLRKAEERILDEILAGYTSP